MMFLMAVLDSLQMMLSSLAFGRLGSLEQKKNQVSLMIDPKSTAYFQLIHNTCIKQNLVYKTNISCYNCKQLKCLRCNLFELFETCT